MKRLKEFLMEEKKTSEEIAKYIVALCKRLGWTFQVRGTIFTIYKKIKPNDNEDFTTADMEYGSILELLPRSSAGSDWGTDGGGIGAMSALQSGIFKMNRSGGNKRVLTALSRMQ